jgi:hypothetical protein
LATLNHEPYFPLAITVPVKTTVAFEKDSATEGVEAQTHALATGKLRSTTTAILISDRNITMYIWFPDKIPWPSPVGIKRQPEVPVTRVLSAASRQD